MLCILAIACIIPMRNPFAVIRISSGISFGLSGTGIVTHHMNYYDLFYAQLLAHYACQHYYDAVCLHLCLDCVSWFTYSCSFTL